MTQTQNLFVCVLYHPLRKKKGKKYMKIPGLQLSTWNDT